MWVKCQCVEDMVTLEQVAPLEPQGGSEWSDAADSITLSDSDEGRGGEMGLRPVYSCGVSQPRSTSPPAASWQCGGGIVDSTQPFERLCS